MGEEVILPEAKNEVELDAATYNLRDPGLRPSGLVSEPTLQESDIRCPRSLTQADIE